MMITHLLLERLSRAVLPRTPESQAIMQDPAQVHAFMDSGRSDGVLNYIYLFHAAMSLPLIRPGDVVLDLACGPANQLIHLASLHPGANFIGLDASDTMLAQAAGNLAAAGVSNVQLQRGDISRLEHFAAASVDCVLCTMSLHHLPDTQQLLQTMQQLRRVLQPEGGIYLADFGRLKRRATQHFFAHDRIELQSPQFTADFLNSMQAAFSLDELQQATAALRPGLDCYQTSLAPFMVLFRSAARQRIDTDLAQRLLQRYRQLSAMEQRDFDNLLRWFRLGGLSLPCALD